MSIAALNAVTEILADPACDLAPRPRLVLFLLANYAGKDGTCHPSRRRLAGMANASPSSIKRDLAELARQQFIEIEERYNAATGARASSTIKLIAVASPAHSCEPTPVQSYDPTPVQNYDPTPAHSCDLTNKPTTEPTIEPSFNQNDRPPDAYGNLKAAFNGSTDAMLADVQRFMGPTAERADAMNWLTGTLSSYGKDRTLRAWTIVTAKIGQGSDVRKPLPFWARTADSLALPDSPPDRSKQVFIPSRLGAGKWVPKEAVQ